MKKKPVEAQVTPAEVVSPPVAEISAQEQDRLRQEGRQQVEAETNDHIKQLSDQVKQYRWFLWNYFIPRLVVNLAIQ